MKHSLAVASATVVLRAIETVPAMAAPPGQVSDLVHQKNGLWKFNVVAQTVCMVVAGTLFFLRCFVRLGGGRLARQWILEDWMVCLSFTGLCVYSTLMGLMMNNHAGVHQWDLTPDQAHRVLYYFWIETIIYGPFIFCTKFSILLLYLRLLVPTRWSPLWTTIQIFVGISASFYTAITIAKIFQCDPIPKTWDKTIPGECINLPVLLEVSGLFNTISDALILLVPIKAVWNLKMGVKKKIGVCGVFTIGAIAPIFSAIGFSARVKTATSHDTTYNQPVILLWGTAEVTTGVICACLPCLPALLRGRKKPSTVHSSHPRSHAGQRSSDNSYPSRKAFGNSQYHELDEFGTEESDKAVVTTVQAGNQALRAKKSEDDDNSPQFWGNPDRFTEDWAAQEKKDKEEEERKRKAGLGGIVRTVRIEQTGA